MGQTNNPVTDTIGGNNTEYKKLEEKAQFFRNRNVKDYAIDTTKGIDEGCFVSIGGIKQWISIRGDDRSAPVLLFLHGGPGEATSLWAYPYFLPWEKYFVVVQWDQRGAGRTFGKSGSAIASTLTLDRMIKDGIEVSEYLCKHLKKRKIVLVAHSFGTILGLRMVGLRPDLFSAYVGTGQVADETQNYAVAYKALLNKAKNAGDREAIDELDNIGPPPYKSSKGYQVQRKWSNWFEGSYRFLPATVGLALLAPHSTVRDVNDLLDGEMFSGDLVSQTQSITMKDLGLNFSIPVFFFEGKDDFTTPTDLSEQYLKLLKAPKKEFVPIPGGHFAVFMNSDDFLHKLISHVLPIATIF